MHGTGADCESECRGAEADENHASSLLPPGTNPGERLVCTDPKEHYSTQITARPRPPSARERQTEEEDEVANQGGQGDYH